MNEIFGPKNCVKLKLLLIARKLDNILTQKTYFCYICRGEPENYTFSMCKISWLASKNASKIMKISQYNFKCVLNHSQCMCLKLKNDFTPKYVFPKWSISLGGECNPPSPPPW